MQTVPLNVLKLEISVNGIHLLIMQVDNVPSIPEPVLLEHLVLVLLIHPRNTRNVTGQLQRLFIL
jgi:hypothetical protein